MNYEMYARLSCSCLAVRKERAIVALQHLLQHRTNDVMVYEGLVCFRTKDKVKWVCARWGRCDDAEARDRCAGFN